MKRWWEVLRDRFQELRVSQVQLGKELGVPKQTVGAWLTGRREPPLSTVQWLCDRAGVSIAQVIADDPYVVTNPVERELLDLWRSMTETERAALALITKRKV